MPIRRGLGWTSVWSFLALGVAATSIVACSAEGDAGGELETDPIETELMLDETPETPDQDASFDQKRGMELSGDERTQLDTYFATQGVPEESLSYEGRTIAVEGDMLLDADNILRSMDQAVEKGTTPRVGGLETTALSRCNPTPAGGHIECPAGSNYQFWRPFIASPGYHVVVNSSFQYHFDLVNTVANTLENLSSDAIGSNVFTVIKAAEYNALPQATRDAAYKINVVINDNQTVGNPGLSCSGANTTACMQLPFISCQVLQAGQACVSRMRIGRHMGIRTDTTNGAENSARNQGIVMHEFLHGLGLGHFNHDPTPIAFLYVPGTSRSLNDLSIMYVFNDESLNWRNTLQADDMDTVRTLYPAGSATYIHAFSNVVAR
jgi:hypothetical protein